MSTAPMSRNQVPPRGAMESPEAYALRLLAMGVPMQGGVQRQAPRVNFMQEDAQTRPATPPKPSFWTAPQGPNETDANMAIRQALAYGGQQLGEVIDPLGTRSVKRVASIFDTPASRAEAAATRSLAPQAAARAFAGDPGTSYKDPRWAGLEANAEKKYGLPAGALALIRERGERSNGDQVSPAGARTVYQIMPATAEGIEKNYGEKAYGSPQQQAMAAAAILAENMRRTGSLEGAVQQYHGGLDPKNYGPQNAAYMERVFGNVAAAGGLRSGFDPSYGNAAMAEIDRGAAAAMQPQSMTVDMTEAPAFPDAPEPVQPTDYSKVDAAIEKLKPHEMLEKDQLALRRSEWMAGIGQALMSLPDGAGLGKVLAAVGGGALMGAAKGDAEVRARMDKQDELMARYNSAVANNELAKAQNIADTARHNADMTWKYTTAKFAQESEKFFKFNGVSISGDAIVSSKLGADGQLKITRTPIVGAVQAAASANKAQIMAQLGGQANAAAGQLANTTNSLILSTATQAAAMDSSPDEQAGGAALGMAVIARDVVGTGQAAALFGNSFDAVMEPIKQRVMQMHPDITSKEHAEALEAAIQVEVVKGMASDPAFRKRVLELGGASAAVAESRRRADGKTTTTTGPKGTTVRESY